MGAETVLSCFDVVRRVIGVLHLCLYSPHPQTTMRNLLSGLLLALTLAAPALSSPEVAHPASVEEDVLGIQQPPKVAPVASAEGSESGDEATKPTVFNGETVPPMKELTGPGFDKEAKDGYWYGTCRKKTLQRALA